MFGIDDAALAIMLAGGISTAAGLYTNKKNREYQEEANRISWDIAQQNNATQIEMANTAHQREVRDLRAAKLNPILSAGGSGAPVPTLQAASIDPVHMDNAFEGLANSAKGLTRYISQQYKNQLEQQRADVALTDAQSRLADNDSKMQAANYEWNMLERDSQKDSLTADYLRGQVDKVATMQEFGLDPVRNKDGSLRVEIRDYSKLRDAVDLAREGLRSDLKLRSNANWRANLSSFTPFVSPSAIQSGTNAARQLRALVK